MDKFAGFVVKKRKLILFISILFLIPSIIGYLVTKINYNFLVYLPSDIETINGQNILTNDFDIGAFSVSIVNDIDEYELSKLEENIRKIDCVTEVMSVNDLTGTSIPTQILPKKFLDRVAKGDNKLLLIIFSTGTSDGETMKALDEINKLSDHIIIGGMSAMIRDMKNIVSGEMVLYVIVASLCCIFILMVSLDSFVVPFILIGNIGLAIIYNMGSNFFLGEISYITQALAAVLQLGVTTDFSIFLYHKYEESKSKYDTEEEAMKESIKSTMISVVGSSLTTIAGFLSLCSMKLTLGTDIGVVMAKGVLFGVLTVLVIFPSLLLTFDNIIFKTRHKPIIPKFSFVSPFVKKSYKIIFIIFIIWFVPAYLSEKNTEVYYKLDSSIPEGYDYTDSSKILKEEFGLVSQEMILVNKNIDENKISKMIDEINNLDGIDSVISSNVLNDNGINTNIIPSIVRNMLESNSYKLVLVNSDYDVATNELNNQISELNKIVKKYDKAAIVAGEGPLMNDLVEISAIDFVNVNYVSIAVIVVIMLFVLRSISLPFLLVLSIEFAIFVNIGFSYWQDISLPFITSIVIGTIQLGATIDYAILMTTNYLRERKKGKDKIKSIGISLDSSVSSIFISAMCFFGATIGVYVVSKIDMIGSICLLLARGAIISMLVVTFIVPSVLLIFDKIIIKTTFDFRKEKKMKKNIKKFAIYLLFITLLLLPNLVNATTKDESIYAKLNSDGSINNVTISEHIFGFNGKSISDKSNLGNIKSTNGIKFDNDNGNLIWKSEGKDIYYQGNYNKDLPVGVSVKYYLNGVERNVKDIIGRKGNIKIVLKYNNSLSKNVNINGKKEKINIPYMVLTTTVLENSNNKNIKVTNGRIIDNGVTSIIIGLTSPGLYESMKIDELKKLNKIEISFDTDSFELGTIYSIATSNLFDESTLDYFDDMDKLYSDINTLQKSMDKIVDASKQLSSGSDKMNDGITLLNSKMQELVEKYKYYRNQDKDVLKEELIKIIEKNINEISPELQEEIINETSKIIKDNKEQIEKDIISFFKQNTKLVIQEEINKIISSLDIDKLVDEVIKENLNKLVKDDENVEKIINELKKYLNNDLKEIVRNEINSYFDSIDVNNDSDFINNLSTKYGISYEQALSIANDVKDNTINKIKQNINISDIANNIANRVSNSDSVSEPIAAYVNLLNNKLQGYLADDNNFSNYSKQIKDKIISSLQSKFSNSDIFIDNDIKNYLDNLVNEIIDRTARDLGDKYTVEYANRVVRNVVEKQFSEENIDSKVREMLDKYDKDIDEKVNILDDTINTLSTSFEQLNDGSKQLSKGMNMLSNGLDKYNKEGIKKLNKIVNNDVRNIQSRLEAIIKLSNKYNIVDEIGNNTNGNSKIIFMIDSISKPTETSIEDDKKNSKSKNKKKSLWSKIKGLFE